MPEVDPCAATHLLVYREIMAAVGCIDAVMGCICARWGARVADIYGVVAVRRYRRAPACLAIRFGVPRGGKAKGCACFEGVLSVFECGAFIAETFDRSCFLAVKVEGAAGEV